MRLTAIVLYAMGIAITSALTFALGASQAEAAPRTVGGGRMTIARWQYDGGGDWYSGPTMLPRLLTALRERTTVPAATKDATVRIESPEVYDYPMLFATGHGNIRLNEAQQQALKRYLDRGGFVWVDDNYGMNESFRQEMTRLFPDSPLTPIPFDHPIYHQLYDFPQGLPKVHRHDGGAPQGLGLFLKGRMALFFSFNTDIGNGLEDPEVHNDPAEVREQALRMAINICLYALTQP